MRQPQAAMVLPAYAALETNTFQELKLSPLGHESEALQITRFNVLVRNHIHF